MNARAPKTRRNQHDSTRSGGGINHTPKRSPFVPIGSGTDGLLAIGVSRIRTAAAIVKYNEKNRYFLP